MPDVVLRLVEDADYDVLFRIMSKLILEPQPPGRVDNSRFLLDCSGSGPIAAGPPVLCTGIQSGAADFAEQPLDRDRYGADLDRLLADKSVVLRAIVLDGEVVGSIIAADTGHIPQIRLFVDPARWNQGIGTSALLAFTTMMKRRPLQARVPAANLSAIRVLEKAGFAPGRSAGDSSDDICFELGFFPASTFVGTNAS